MLNGTKHFITNGPSADVYSIMALTDKEKRGRGGITAFIIGYLGRRSDTLYTIPIMNRRCILPGGMEVAA